MAQFRESALAVQRPENQFTVDKPVPGEVVITDINNPPKRPYKHQEYPKVMYHHGPGPISGRVIQVADKNEEKAAEKKGFKVEPSPNHDYSRVQAGRAAENMAAPNDRELTAAQLEKLDEHDPE